MKIRRIFLALVLMVLVVSGLADTNTAHAATFTGSKNYSVVSNGVTVLTIKFTTRYDWRLSDGKVKCYDATYPRYSIVYAAPGWTAQWTSLICVQSFYYANGQSMGIWDIKYNGTKKGYLQVWVDVVQDTSPPNWSWHVVEQVP